MPFQPLTSIVVLLAFVFSLFGPAVDTSWLPGSSSSGTTITASDGHLVVDAKKKKKKKRKPKKNKPGNQNPGNGGGNPMPTPTQQPQSPPPCTIGGRCVVNQTNRHGWGVDNEGFPFFDFAPDETPPPMGSGSFHFGPVGSFIPNQIILTAPTPTLVSDFQGISYHQFVSGGSPGMIFVRLRVDQPENGIGTLAITDYADCEYVYGPPGVVGSWQSVTVNFSLIGDGTGSCPANYQSLSSGTRIVSLQIIGGDRWSADDSTLQGKFDKVDITNAGVTTTYDFEE